jgi:hypothetical protein
MINARVIQKNRKDARLDSNSRQGMSDAQLDSNSRQGYACATLLNRNLYNWKLSNVVHVTRVRGRGIYRSSRSVHWPKGATKGTSGRPTDLPCGRVAWSSMQPPFPMQNIPSQCLRSVPVKFEWVMLQSGASRPPPGPTQPRVWPIHSSNSWRPMVT